MKNVLICVSGLTPQIVTETLFCLAYKEKIPIDEIYVFTTKRGRDVIIGRDKHPATPKVTLKKEIEELCRKYKIKKPEFEENERHIIVAKEESIELSDVRSDKDNILFPNKLANFIRSITADSDTTLYCSITGGRKSMSVHLANVLALFAREQDKLLHVLTQEKNEFKDFFPKNRKEIKELELAEIPFVRLRSLLLPELKQKVISKLSYADVVSLAQKELKVISERRKLVINIERRELCFGDSSIAFEPLEFLFYYHFINEKMRGNNKISVHDFINERTKERFIEYFNEYYPNYYLKDFKWYKKGFSKEEFRVKRSKVNNKLKALINDDDVFKLFCIDVNKKYGESVYYIQADKNRFIIKQ